MTDSTYHPLSGLWQPSQLQRMYYGPSSVSKYLVSVLPSPNSKAFIITGSSLASKTPLVKDVESLLGKHHAGTFSNIGQHAPVADIDKATDLVQSDSAIDTVVSIGGGSPIDAAKAVSSRLHDKGAKFLFHVAIPTTLSVAECTFIAGFTQADGTKALARAPELVPHVIIYDATFAKHTPEKLWLSTAIRALDHAVELLYNPTAAEAPTKYLCLAAIRNLFENLPKAKQIPEDEDIITRLQLGCFSSLYPIGLNVKGGIGLSHSLGYALGSPYQIPHGITSCITLPGVVRLKAEDPGAAEQIARILPIIGKRGSGDDKKDALTAADAIEGLVKELGLTTSVKEYNVGEDQIPIIAKRGTGGDEGELYKRVSELVKTFYF
ncbi:MAG: hypothetical protein MMC23_001357 [Stictis urceolatum]|nr:hypothetical protein [Stictis urceolata]